MDNKLILGLVVVLQSAVLGQSFERWSVSSAQAEGNANSYESVISSSGRYGAFVSDASNLTEPVSAQQVYRRDRKTLTTQLVSVDTSGVPATSASWRPTISANGRWIAFTSAAALVLPDASVGLSDIYLRDLGTGTTSLVTQSTAGVGGNYASDGPSISDDGRYIVFSSNAINLVPSDTNGKSDIFVRDLLLNTTTRISLPLDGGEANGDCRNPCFSADGSTIAFESNATNLPVSGTLVSEWHIYLYDVASGDLTSATNTHLVVGNGASGAPRLSSTGRYVVFESYASNFVGSDPYGRNDCFRLDTLTGNYRLVSAASGGGYVSDAGSRRPRISHDGRFVLFTSSSNSIISGGALGYQSAYLRDMQAGATRIVSRPITAAFPSGSSEGGDLAADAAVVCFSSVASDFVPGDANNWSDVFAYTEPVPHTSLYCSAKTNSQNCVPQIHAWKPLSLSGPDDCVLYATQELNLKQGLMIWGTAQGSVPFHGATICVQPIKRTASSNSGGSLSSNDCTGVYFHHFTQAFAASNALQPGHTVCCQFWSRDPGMSPPMNFALTQAVALLVQP